MGAPYERNIFVIINDSEDEKRYLEAHPLISNYLLQRRRKADASLVLYLLRQYLNALTENPDYQYARRDVAFSADTSIEIENSLNTARMAFRDRPDEHLTHKMTKLYSWALPYPDAGFPPEVTVISSTHVYA